MRCVSFSTEYFLVSLQSVHQAGVVVTVGNTCGYSCKVSVFVVRLSPKMSAQYQV